MPEGGGLLPWKASGSRHEEFFHWEAEHLAQGVLEVPKHYDGRYCFLEVASPVTFPTSDRLPGHEAGGT